MAFCFTVGTHDFRGPLQGYENVTAQCHRCGNWSAHCETEFPMFTICFVPLIPMAVKKYKLVACPICGYKQDLVYVTPPPRQGGERVEDGCDVIADGRYRARPDVQSMAHGGGGGGAGPPPPQQHGYGGPPQGPPPGQGGGPPQGGYYGGK
ncbi:hypothetical protein MMC10_004088 [Thelotrema lepadinum]|nr:hypothetical protein [Thelotrema lepadinum]